MPSTFLVNTNFTMTIKLQFIIIPLLLQPILLLDYLFLLLYLSRCIFSILLFTHLLRCWQGEFVYKSKASFVGDHFLYSYDHNVQFRSDIMGRNLMLITLTVYKVNFQCCLIRTSTLGQYLNPFITCSYFHWT